MAVDPRVDAYIAAAQPFAQPLLSHIRATMHRHCADMVETIKWGFPVFTYKGTIVATLAAFKAHASLGFWYGEMVTGDTGHDGPGMGSFGRLTVIADIPDDAALCSMIVKSMALVDTGAKPAHKQKPSAPKPEAQVPPALAAALSAHQKAQAVWDAFAPGQRREYCAWIDEAKRDETRNRRVGEAVAWIADGKSRNWKYQNC